MTTGANGGCLMMEVFSTGWRFCRSLVYRVCNRSISREGELIRAKVLIQICDASKLALSKSIILQI